VAKVLAGIVRGASYDDLAVGARITTVTAAICLIAYLIVTVRHRSLDRTAGYALLALGLLAPVLYPWYLLWGAVCLAPSANGERRIGVLALCAAGCVLVPQGFTPTTANVITAGALAVVAGLTAVAVRRSTGAPPLPTAARSVREDAEAGEGQTDQPTAGAALPHLDPRVQ
jgi:hypothetical protein